MWPNLLTRVERSPSSPLKPTGQTIKEHSRKKLQLPTTTDEISNLLKICSKIYVQKSFTNKVLNFNQTSYFIRTVN